MSATIHHLNAVRIDRSVRREVRNPVYALRAVDALEQLSNSAKHELGSALKALRADALERAQECWVAKDAQRAVYWKALAVYSGHISRVIRTEQPAPKKLRRIGERRSTLYGHVRLRRVSANPCLRLDAVKEIFEISRDAQEALSLVLVDLHIDAKKRAENCWKKCKPPLAAYWKGVSVFARHLAQVIRIQRALERKILTSECFDDPMDERTGTRFF